MFHLLIMFLFIIFSNNQFSHLPKLKQHTKFMQIQQIKRDQLYKQGDNGDIPTVRPRKFLRVDLYRGTKQTMFDEYLGWFYVQPGEIP